MASWRDDLKIHPAADLFPLLSETDPAALKERGKDIKRHGLTSPIVLWCDGKSPAVLLDGRDRLDAIESVIGPVEIGPPSLSAGKDFLALNKVIVLDKSTDPYAYVISANIHRRHLTTAEQRRDLIAEVLKANPQKSDRQIAEQVKDDHKKVGRVRRALEATGAMPQFTATTGKDGKSRTRPPPPPTYRVPSAEEMNRRYAERQARPEWVKRRERERDARAEERDEQKRQEQARKQERTQRDLAGFNINKKAHREIALDLIDAGYRALAKAAHPDTTRDDGEAMRSLNNARDFLRATVAARTKVSDIGPDSTGEIERLRSEIDDLKAALEKSATDRAEALYRALDPIKIAGLPITDQLIILVGFLFEGLAPIKGLVAALRLPENASLKRQSQLEGLQAMTGVVFDWMSVVREQVAEIKRALDEYAEPKASESNHDGVGEIEASPAATVASPPVTSEAHDLDGSGDEQADPFVIPGFMRRTAP